MPAHDPLVFGAIADDLTGGSELASMLVARGVKTKFTIGSPGAINGRHDAHVVALKTRVIPPDQAVSKVLAVAEALISHGTRQIFFKYCATFDSTPAGNIGPCAEALLDRLGERQTVFCPAFCEVNRTVYQGHMFGESQLLSETPKRYDPLTPMTDSNLVRVLQGQSRRKVGLVSHVVVDAGADAIRAACEALDQKGLSLLIVDTLYERHLAAIARACADMTLLTGNSSIAAHLPPVWLERKLLPAPSTAELPAIDGPGAVLVGSVAEQTLNQLAHFSRTRRVITLDIARAFAGNDVVGEAIAFARRAMEDGQTFAISTAMPPASVAQLQSAYGTNETAAKAESILSDVARAIVFDLGIRRLVVAGGETSGAVVSALGISELAIGPYQGPGIARAVAESPVHLALMLKSGKLGKADIFETVLDDMKRPLSVRPLLKSWPPG